MKILVVDDIAANRRLLRAQLEAEGYAVVEAADGVEAMAVLAVEPFDAVISDILMPRMDGFRLCHEVRMDPRFHLLRFVLYSSTYTSPADVRLSDTVGATVFLMKPAPIAAILAALEVPPEARPPGGPAEFDDTVVLEQYSAVLVAKLEEKNAELRQALEESHSAQKLIQELNVDLERRVQERTRELVTANSELTAAFAEVKQLNHLLPICSFCKNVRDDKDYWESVESYITHHTNSRFSHGVCPDCFNKHYAPMLKNLGVDIPPGADGRAP